jgi:hypothetical protein
MSCLIEWYGNNVHWKFVGEITTSQIIEVFAGLYGDARFDDTRGQIRNFLDFKSQGFSVQDVQKIAAYDRAAAKSNPRMKIALVACGQQEVSALASLYDAELHDTPWEVNIFRCFHEALAWLA